MDIKVIILIMSLVTFLFLILIFRRLWVTRKSKCTKLDINKIYTMKKPMVLDLRNCDVGVRCEEYTLLIVANSKNTPESVHRRINQHIESCAYHNSSVFYQSALGIMVDSDLEIEAIKIIEKYNLNDGTVDLVKKRK